MTQIKSLIDYKNELNDAQCAAVFSIDGPHLVIAGAGSGKTRVLVYRTAYLVEQGADPGEVLLLTFTRRAAREMLERACVLVDDRCRRVAGGTFHSFANLALRRYGEHIGLARNFSIIDEADQEQIIQLIRQHFGLHKLDKRFPKKNTLLSIISKSINKDMDVESIVYEEYPHCSEWIEPIGRVKEEYRKHKRAMALVDYDDLLNYLCELLSSQPEICRRLSTQYRYIMVDEYQDTNKMQAQAVRLLTSAHSNIMVVGDDSQSIYSFRGAYFKNIIDFPNIFPGTKVIMLEENYRSSQPILDLTNQVIQCAAEKFEKELFSNQPGDTIPIYADTYNENAQSKYIVNKILTLRARGVKLNEMAVLFRSGWHSNDLEIALAGEGIPFVKYGGQKFVEAAHIKDVLSFLQIIYNPRNEAGWLRILTLLPGIGEQTAVHIIDQVVRQNKKLAIDQKYFNKREELKRLFAMLQQISDEQMASADDDTPEEQRSIPCTPVLKKIFEFYYPILRHEYDDYDKRLNDLESLERIAQRYTSLEELLSDMVLEPPEKTIVDRDFHKKATPHLTLSTIHSAKGLEWDTVFLIHLTEGCLPSYRSLNNPQAVEEERRLFYVATTRAKENLFLLRPRISSGQSSFFDGNTSMFTKISRFLHEGGILQNFVNVETDEI